MKWNNQWPLIYRWGNTGLGKSQQVKSEAAMGPELTAHILGHSMFSTCCLPTYEHHMPKNRLSMGFLLTSMQQSRCLEFTRWKIPLDMSAGNVSENLLHSCTRGPEALFTIMVGPRSMHTLWRSRAYASSCPSRLSEEQVGAWGHARPGLTPKLSAISCVFSARTH